MIALAASEEIIDASGVAPRIEAMLPAGVRARQLLVRTLLLGMLLVLAEGGQRLVDAGQVSGPVIGGGQAHAGQQGADPELPGPHPGREHGLDAGRGAGGVDDLLERHQPGHGRRAAPSSLTASASPAGSSPATRSPSR